MTREEAFEKIIKPEGEIYQKEGNKVANMIRHRYRKNKLTIEFKESKLKEYGYQIIRPAKWKKTAK